MSDRERHEDGDGELDLLLARLPKIDVDDWRSARILARALETLERGEGPKWLRTLEVAYGRVIEPALVFAIGPLYVAWCVGVVISLHS